MSCVIWLLETIIENDLSTKFSPGFYFFKQKVIIILIDSFFSNINITNACYREPLLFDILLSMLPYKRNTIMSLK